MQARDDLVATAAYQPEPAAAAAARRFVRDTLRTWQVAGQSAGQDELIDDAVLLTSELVTNAVVHAGTPVQVTCRLADGAVEVVVTQADGITLKAPNDLTFGSDGRLYFTDSGDWDPINLPDPGYICVVEHDGTCHVLEELEPVYPNGIVAESGGAIVWVESYTRRVVRRRPDGSSDVIHELPEGHVPDGLKIDVDGNFWITTFSSGGVDVIGSDGSFIDFLETGGVPLNCVFLGTSLFVCDFGTTDTGDATPMFGRLLKVDVGIAGMPLHRGAIS